MRVHHGLTIGEYVAESPIGMGGSGEVWRARDVTTGEAVAVKALFGKGQHVVERLRREANVLASVAGPHVVRLRDLLVEDDRAYLVMDLAAGGSLEDLFEERDRIPAPEVVTILAPIASALAAAHARDLVHGDITPANILFTADGRPLLADFGVVQAVGATEPVEGTFGYLDPAVANGERPTPASDVFGLAAVGFAALTGKLVWGSGSPEQLEGRALLGLHESLPELAPDVPPALADVIESALALDPYDRPDARTFASKVLHACAAAPVDIPVVAHLVAAPVTSVIRRRAIDHDDVDDVEAEALSRGKVRWPWKRAIVVAVFGAIMTAVSLALSALLGHVHLGVPHVVDGKPPVGNHSALTPTAATVRPAAEISPAGWRAVVARLDADRAAAFASADPDRLAAVYVAGSPAYDTDLATISSLQSRGLRARGFSATVEAATPVSGSGANEQLRVVDRLSGYRLVDLTGHVVGHGDPRPARTFTMWLHYGAAGWQVAKVSSLP